jgi:hypothetical protein
MKKGKHILIEKWSKKEGKSMLLLRGTEKLKCE